MDHIFGDSDEIDFGSSPATQAPVLSPLDRRSPVLRKPATLSPRASSSAPVRAHSPRRPVSQVPVIVDPITVDSISALSHLIDGMKPSFLPREEDMMNIRLVAMSSPTEKDPLFLVRQDDTTILLGSGFGSISRVGKEYTTFPDMRLIFSEKERVRAWILTDSTIDVSRFEYILPTLGFPPIYGTRDVIAAFRNNMKNQSILESCRFFELFADGMNSRRIGDIECIIANIGSKSILALKAGNTSFGFAHITLPLADSGTPILHTLQSKNDRFYFDNEPFVIGEVLSIKGKLIARNPMKFTFDTFFIDGLSIGVVAGYTLGDRDQLAENGVLTFTLEEDSRARTIAGHIFIDSRGFVHAYEMMHIHKEILKGIRASYEKFLTENPKIERGELVQGLRREITKYCYLLTGRTPVVMPMVIER